MVTLRRLWRRTHEAMSRLGNLVADFLSPGLFLESQGQIRKVNEYLEASRKAKISSRVFPSAQGNASSRPVLRVIKNQETPTAKRKTIWQEYEDKKTQEEQAKAEKLLSFEKRILGDYYKQIRLERKSRLNRTDIITRVTENLESDYAELTRGELRHYVTNSINKNIQEIYKRKAQRKSSPEITRFSRSHKMSAATTKRILESATEVSYASIKENYLAKQKSKMQNISEGFSNYFNQESQSYSLGLSDTVPTVASFCRKNNLSRGKLESALKNSNYESIHAVRKLAAEENPELLNHKYFRNLSTAQEAQYSNLKLATTAA